MQKLNCTDPGKEFTSTDTPNSYGRRSSSGGVRLEIENIILVKTRVLFHFLNQNSCTKYTWNAKQELESVEK